MVLVNHFFIQLVLEIYKRSRGSWHYHILKSHAQNPRQLGDDIRLHDDECQNQDLVLVLPNVQVEENDLQPGKLRIILLNELQAHEQQKLPVGTLRSFWKILKILLDAQNLLIIEEQQIG